MEPPGGTIATRRSKALQLFVYISLTKARGTSPFLQKRKLEVDREASKRTCS